MAWRIAESLKTLRAQINAAYPNRDKRSDGGIGDAAHASRNSDHNPWVKDRHGVGVVTAIDIDEDLAPNIHSIENIVKALQASKDPRIKYIIYEKRITVPGDITKWKPYHGKNPHDHHAHISVKSTPNFYDSTALWKLNIQADPPLQELTPATVGDVIDAQRTDQHSTAAATGNASDAPIAHQAIQIEPTPANDPVAQASSASPSIPTETVQMVAPEKDGSVSAAAKMTIAGVVVPPFLVGIIRAVQDAIAGGFVDAREIGNVVINLITSNLRYVAILIGVIVLLMTVKKIVKQITFWLSMVSHMSPHLNTIEVVPREVKPSRWWQIWK